MRLTLFKTVENTLFAMLVRQPGVIRRRFLRTWMRRWVRHNLEEEEQTLGLVIEARPAPPRLGARATAADTIKAMSSIKAKGGQHHSAPPAAAPPRGLVAPTSPARTVSYGGRQRAPPSPAAPRV